MMAVLESWMQGVSDTGFIYSPIHGLSSCSWRVGGGRRYAELSLVEKDGGEARPGIAAKRSG